MKERKVPAGRAPRVPENPVTGRPRLVRQPKLWMRHRGFHGQGWKLRKQPHLSLVAHTKLLGCKDVTLVVDLSSASFSVLRARSFHPFSFHFLHLSCFYRPQVIPLSPSFSRVFCLLRPFIISCEELAENLVFLSGVELPRDVLSSNDVVVFGGLIPCFCILCA